MNPGFSVEEGVTFSASIEPKTNLTRQFRHVCMDFPDVITPNGDGWNDTSAGNWRGSGAASPERLSRLQGERRGEVAN